MLPPDPGVVPAPVTPVSRAAPYLREAFLAADFTADAVPALLGPVAHGALARQETVPARRVTAGGSPAETLVRLFLLQLPVPLAQARDALPLEHALATGLVGLDGDGDGDQVRALLDVRPYDDFYVVSDLDTGLGGVTRPLAPEHVLGVGAASTTLAELTVRPPVTRSLDIGTGCGVQALHLAQHSREVVATDVLPRALRLAAFSAALSEVELTLREGSLFGPVQGARFDLIVSNPPFVVGPAGRFTYRDSGLPGDAVCARLVAAAADHLTPGGTFQCLANWLHRRGEDWRERVGSWLPSECDAWVVQREVQDPAQYVSLWLHDSGEIRAADAVQRYDAWMSWFEAACIEGVGFGWIALRRTGATPTVRVEDWPNAVEQPLGRSIEGWFERAAWLRAHDDRALTASRLRVAPDVVQETIGPPGAEDPERIVLRQHQGMRRGERVDTALAALAGACDGTLAVGRLIDAVAQALGEDRPTLSARLVPAVRRLVEDGVLEPMV
jgi:methylase of polypeptide subunit release factors